MAMEKILVGWKEWCALPELGLSAVKVKIDTGAKTSSLHAVNIKTYEQEGTCFAKFDVYPVQRNNVIKRTCTALMVDQRHVRSSSGHAEHRHVISTAITLAGITWDIHITLTDRDAMGMRMLLGREAMKKRIMVNPSKSFCHGKMTSEQAKRCYVN